MIDFTKPDPVDFHQLVIDLRESGLSTVTISRLVDCPKRTILDLSRHGRQPRYPLGNALVKLHRSRVKEPDESAQRKIGKHITELEAENAKIQKSLGDWIARLQVAMRAEGIDDAKANEHLSACVKALDGK